MKFEIWPLDRERAMIGRHGCDVTMLKQFHDSTGLTADFTKNIRNLIQKISAEVFFMK